MNFIEKLDWIYNQSVDLGEVTEKLGAKNNIPNLKVFYGFVLKRIKT